MDGLSVAASIFGIISLADVVFVRVTKYVKAAKNADKEVKELRQEVLLLLGAVHSLSKLAQVYEADGLKDISINQLRMHHISACQDTLDEIQKKLNKIGDNSLKRKLVWPFTTEKTKELLADISRHKDVITLALSAESLSSLLQVLSNDKILQKTAQDILEHVKKTEKIVARIDMGNQHSHRRAIVDFFLKYNPQQNYEMSLRLRHPRTGLWLTLMPQFQTWVLCPDSRLWLSGIPGAGKTVLAGTIVEQALQRSSDQVATAFFFCDYKDGRTQTPENILCALASQLAIQKEETYALLERHHTELHPKAGLPRNPSRSDLQRLLQDMVKSFDHVFLIVDGLDECGDHTPDVIDALLEILDESDNISAAFLSRDEDDIRDRLVPGNHDGTDTHGDDEFVRIEIAAHTQDVMEFVTAEIETRITNRRLRLTDLEVKGEIIERLIAGAKGM